jgi:hypothetical protein
MYLKKAISVMGVPAIEFNSSLYLQSFGAYEHQAGEKIMW